MSEVDIAAVEKRLNELDFLVKDARGTLAGPFAERICAIEERQERDKNLLQRTVERLFDRLEERVRALEAPLAPASGRTKAAAAAPGNGGEMAAAAGHALEMKVAELVETVGGLGRRVARIEHDLDGLMESCRNVEERLREVEGLGIVFGDGCARRVRIGGENGKKRQESEVCDDIEQKR